jgi:hypothetical protein
MVYGDPVDVRVMEDSVPPGTSVADEVFLCNVVGERFDEDWRVCVPPDVEHCES